MGGGSVPLAVAVFRKVSSVPCAASTAHPRCALPDAADRACVRFMRQSAMLIAHQLQIHRIAEIR